MKVKVRLTEEEIRAIIKKPDVDDEIAKTSNGMESVCSNPQGVVGKEKPKGVLSIPLSNRR